MRVGSTYYAYATTLGDRYLPVLTSTDLTNWYIHPNYASGNPGTPGWSATIPAEIMASPAIDWYKHDENDALVKPASWGLSTPSGPWMTRTYWAPSVLQIGSTWYAYSAVKISAVGQDSYGRFCLTVATAASPLGPFRDTTTGPIQCQPTSTDPGGSIDPYAYHDATTGKNYLLWKAQGKIGLNESRLMAQELGSNGRPKSGTPVVTLLSTNRQAAWEGSTVEAPAMIRYAGRTYLFYSANAFEALDSVGHSKYATGYAICPRGPMAACTRPTPQTPLLASSGSIQGPGGGSPFLDAQGNLRFAYAAMWLGENRNGTHPRRMYVTQLSALPNGALVVGASGPPPKVQPRGWGGGPVAAPRRPTSWGSPRR
jgi:beta-xylosidase